MFQEFNETLKNLEINNFSLDFRNDIEKFEWLDSNLYMILYLLFPKTVMNMQGR